MASSELERKITKMNELMNQKFELTVLKFMLSLLASALIPTIGFVSVTLTTTARLELQTELLKEGLDKKVDADILLQYMKLQQERQQLQNQLNLKNETKHEKLSNEIHRLEEEIHALEVKMIGYMPFRDPDVRQWNYEKLINFAWNNNVYFHLNNNDI